MRLQCKCGKWHTLSPTGMFVVIRSLINGDLQEVTSKGIVSLCLGEAFTSPSMDELKPTLSGKHTITFDDRTWDLKESRFV